VAAGHESSRQVRQTALLTAAVLFALTFGLTVITAGDRIPGTLIVAASVVGLALWCHQ
jgi:hypothetical protein